MTDFFNLSELNRVMQCFGSTLMDAEPRFPPSTSLKEEGEAAHYLAAAVFNNEFGIEELIDRKAPNGFYITHEMAEHVAVYLNEIYMADASYNEVNVDTYFGGEGWAVKGRADHIGLVGNTLYADAFHYGFRLVPAENNWQLIAAALGYCINNQCAPSTIVLTVHQPRAFRPKAIPGQVSFDYQTLLKHYEKLQENLTKKRRVCTTGPACVVCPYSYCCPAIDAAAMNAVDASEIPVPNEPKGDELAKYLDTLNAAKNAIAAKLKGLEELAVSQLRGGQIVPNYSLESAETALKWNDGLNAETIKMLIGYDVSKPSTITPSQAKKQFNIPDMIIQSVASKKTTTPKLTRVEASKKAERIFAKGKSA